MPFPVGHPYPLCRAFQAEILMPLARAPGVVRSLGSHFLFSLFNCRFSFGLCWAFFWCSLLPLSFFPLSPISITPFSFYIQRWVLLSFPVGDLPCRYHGRRPAASTIRHGVGGARRLPCCHHCAGVRMVVLAVGEAGSLDYQQRMKGSLRGT